MKLEAIKKRANHVAEYCGSKGTDVGYRLQADVECLLRIVRAADTLVDNQMAGRMDPVAWDALNISLRAMEAR